MYLKAAKLLHIILLYNDSIVFLKGREHFSPVRVYLQKPSVCFNAGELSIQLKKSIESTWEVFHTAGPLSQIVLTLPAKHTHTVQLTRGSPLAKISATGV